MAERETPAAWRELMERRGITSARALSRRADVSVQAVLRLMHREGATSEEVMKKIAEALGVSRKKVRELAGVPLGEEDPFVLPDEADRLNLRQRRAIVELVALLLDQDGDTADGNNVTPLSPPPGRPSPETRGLKVATNRDEEPHDDGSTSRDR